MRVYCFSNNLNIKGTYKENYPSLPLACLYSSNGITDAFMGCDITRCSERSVPPSLLPLPRSPLRIWPSPTMLPSSTTTPANQQGRPRSNSFLLAQRTPLPLCPQNLPSSCDSSSDKPVDMVALPKGYPLSVGTVCTAGGNGLVVARAPEQRGEALGPSTQGEAAWAPSGSPPRRGGSQPLPDHSTTSRAGSNPKLVAAWDPCPSG